MLRGSHSMLTLMAGRTLAGGVASFRPMQNGSARRCRYLTFVGEASEPAGYRPSATRSISIKPGAVSSYHRAAGSSSLTAAAARGVNGSTTIAGTATLTGTAALVVPISATINGAATVSGTVVAPVSAVATINGAATAAGTMTAIGHATATLAGVASVSVTGSAIGHMTAGITPFTELSPQSLAAAVWDAIAADYIDSGTTGEALRVIRAVLANRVVTDPAAGTYTVYDVDDATVLVSGDLWQDADGTVAYSGAGAERRDRLT